MCIVVGGINLTAVHAVSLLIVLQNGNSLNFWLSLKFFIFKIQVIKNIILALALLAQWVESKWPAELTKVNL